MSYNPNIPQGTDNLSVSQGQILTNFTSANTTMGVDHYAFDDSTLGGVFQGQHKTTRYPQTIQDRGVPVPVSAGTHGELFTQTVDTGGVHAEPFWADSKGAVNQGLWYGGVTDLTTQTGAVQFLEATNGYILFPNGLQLVWGRVSGGITPGTPVVFSQPFANAVFNIQLTINASNQTVYTAYVKSGSTSATGFTLGGSANWSGSGNDLYYFAIGN